jgi:hypothetical protein
LSVYSNRYNDYNDNYYNYYQPEAIAEKAFKKEESNTYMFIENFISSFKDNEKKVVVNFLYDQYKKYSTHKELGLSILYSYSKIDSKYKAEFEELKK